MDTPNSSVCQSRLLLTPSESPTATGFVFGVSSSISTASPASVVSATSAAGSTPPSPSTTTSAPSTILSPNDLERQRKRARDRKSQQAMRDRTKWTIANLNEQVVFLTQVLDDRARDMSLVTARMRLLETENTQLRTQNAALQLSLMGGTGGASGAVVSPVLSAKEPWQILPAESSPTCLGDQILKGFLASRKHCSLSDETVLDFSMRPNLGALLDKDRQTADAVSDIVGEIVRSYLEIDTLPKQVSVFYIMCCLLKWMVRLDKQSWDLMPAWLRPTEAQVTTPHAAWIDHIPWPNARNYLISHPEISPDHFTTVYSTSLDICWPYDPSHALLQGSVTGDDITINPVYEEHIRQLANWDVGYLFRDHYPDLGVLIDSEVWLYKA